MDRKYAFVGVLDASVMISHVLNKCAVDCISVLLLVAARKAVIYQLSLYVLNKIKKINK